MFRLMTSVLTAAFVTSLIAGVVPGKDPDEPVPAKAKAAGPASWETEKAAGPASRETHPRSEEVLSPTEAASRVGQRVTVEFTVKSTGSNPAGFLELYSGQTWMEEGSFFIRFPGETQQKFEGLGIEDIRKHFARKTVRVTGVVQSMTFSTGGTHPVMVVQDLGQIKIIHTVARNTQPAPPPAPVVPSSDEMGFRSLFNGRDLSGWMVDGGDGSGWRVDGGEIVAVGEGGQSYDFLLSDREYRNFALRFEFKVGENANSGVGVRALLGERVKGRPLNLEVQIRDDEGVPAGQGEPTGSLFWSSGGTFMRPARPARLKPRGEWNAMEVELIGRFLRAAVNGQDVLRVNLELNPFFMNPRVLAGVYRDQGRIGFQRHTGEVRFRNVRIKQLTPQPALVLDAGGHTSQVKCLVFTPDGQQLITASCDKTIRVWDVNTGALVRVLRTPIGSGHIGEHFGVALSPDGKTLAIGGYSGLFLIDLPSGRMLHFLVGHSNSVTSLDFSPDGRRLATASGDKTVRIWDVATGQTVRTLTAHTDIVEAVRFSPDGRKVATGGVDKTARIFSADDGSLITTVTAEAIVWGVDWSQDGQIVGAGGNDKGFVCLWGLDGTLLKRFDALGRVTSLRSTMNGAVLYTWAKNPKKEAVILDLATGQPRAIFNKSWWPVFCSALSPDGQLAATAGFDPADVRIWRTADGQQLHQLRARGSIKWSAGWTADGTTIAWGNQIYRDLRTGGINDMGPRTHSFDLKTLQVGETTGDFQIGSLTLDDLRIEKEEDGTGTLLIKRGGEVVTKIVAIQRGGGSGGNWMAAAWVDRDRLIVGNGFGDVALVDANTGKMKRWFIGHVGTIWAVAPSPDHRHLLTASQDQTLRVWSLDDSSPILSLYFSDEQDWVAWAARGYYAASPGGEQLMGWHVDNGLNAMASFYPASQFRKTLYRPDVIKRLLDAGSLRKALAEADAAAGKRTQQTEVAQILPPKIAITSPASAQVQVNGKTLEVEAVAHSVGTNPVTELRVLLDGRPLPDGLKSFPSAVLGEARGTWTIEVPPGSHRLVVQASSAVSKGLSDPVEIVATAENGTPNGSGTLYVLAIGINDYPDKRLKLDCAAPDAQALRQAFLTNSRRLFPGGIEAKLLLDGQATRENIVGELRRLAGAVKAGDVAVVFYAGHGDSRIEGQFYLVPVDASLRNLSATGISGEALKKAIGELPCTTMLILDACDSGGFDQKKKKRKTRGLPVQSDALVRELVYDSGLVVMCGAAKEQEAAEENGRGFFTRAIVEALSGPADLDKDGVVELDELDMYVRRRVRALSVGDQEPTISIPSIVRSFALSKP